MNTHEAGEYMPATEGSDVALNALRAISEAEAIIRAARQGRARDGDRPLTLDTPNTLPRAECSDDDDDNSCIPASEEEGCTDFCYISQQDHGCSDGTECADLCPEAQLLVAA